MEKDKYINGCLLEKLTVKIAEQKRFDSTTTSWHGLKQAAAFLSLDLKCPHKTKRHQTISHCKVSNVEFKAQRMIADLLPEQRRCEICKRSSMNWWDSVVQTCTADWMKFALCAL